jgi:hypothetical protein
MSHMLSRVIWIFAPLGLAVAAIEFGMLTLPNGTEPVLSLAEIVFGALVVIVVARALLRR